MDTLFSLSALLVMPLWAAMIFLPRWRWTRRVMSSPWSVAPAAALYAALVLPVVATVWPVVASPELAEVALLLGTPTGATIGWVHFLAFDLFVGRWAYLDAAERGISAWVMAPVLFLTIMLGPLGLLLYLGIREAAARRPRTRALAADARRRIGQAGAVSRALTAVGLVMLPLAMLALAGLALDPREIGGSPAWLKPLKFAISISIYSLTLVWMLRMVEGHRRLVRWIGTGSALALAAEWAIIALQAYRGTASHFNASTPLDTALFSLMGVLIVPVWTLNLVAAVLLLRQRFADPAFAWSLRLGLLLSLVGGLVATPMFGPRPHQLQALRAGERVEAIGGHGVGVPDGGPGMPVTGWSTQGGDLRVPHFFGLHGLQVLPLLGLLLGRVRRLRAGHRLALVWTGGLAYLALTGILFWQALRGEPVADPGTATLAAVGGLAFATLAAVTSVLLHARRGHREVRLPPALARAG